MNSNKVVLITSEFPPQPGGIGNHAFNLANQLSKQKYEVTVLADIRSDSGEEERCFDEKLNFEVIRIPRYGFILMTYLQRIVAYRRLVQKREISLVIASGRFSMWLAIFGLRNRRLKKVAMAHGSEINSKNVLIKQLTNTALERFDVVIPVSHYTKSLISHLYLKRVQVIPNGIDMESLQPALELIALKGSPRLVTVGTLSERKGQANVIEKLPSLLAKFPNIHYHMIGIPLEKEYLKKLAKSLKVTQYISFHGVLSTSRMLNVLKTCDIFTMLSNKTNLGDVEGFGIALLEANCMGLPTIGSKGCGIEDAIDNFRSGVLVNPKDVNEFLAAIEELQSNKKMYKENTIDWARKHSWELIIKRYIAVIKSL